jgi:hypothetical protein
VIEERFDVEGMKGRLTGPACWVGDGFEMMMKACIAALAA